MDYRGCCYHFPFAQMIEPEYIEIEYLGGIDNRNKICGLFDWILPTSDPVLVQKELTKRTLYLVLGAIVVTWILQK